jgi:hypothetical protein
LLVCALFTMGAVLQRVAGVRRSYYCRGLSQVGQDGGSIGRRKKKKKEVRATSFASDHGGR